MGRCLQVLAACAGVLGSVAPLASAAGEAEVRFVAPERFTDAAPGSSGTAGGGASVLQELARHIQDLARRGLPAGQTLEVRITDLDLAGLQEPWRLQNPQLRVVTPGTWPRIVLRFRLRDGDRVIRSGEETLVDQSFDARPGRVLSHDRLFAEKALLDRWFRSRFPAQD